MKRSKRKMKICLLSRFFDLRHGGIGRYSMEIEKRLKEMGQQVKAISQDGGIPLGEGRIKYLSYTLFEIKFKIPKGFDLYHACSPTEAFHAPKPLVVFFHDLIPLIYLKESGDWPLKMFPKKFIKWFDGNYFKLASLKAIEKADKILTQSEHVKNELIEIFKVEEDRIDVVRHGIKEDLEPGPKFDDIFRIGTLSYLDPRKRIDILIKAFLRADVDGELLIAGKGVDYPRLKKLAKGDPRIKFLGFIPDELLVDFYNSLDVFIFPTKIEGYGLPIVEAMACKKPVVTLSDNIIPEDVKKRTIIVDDLQKWLADPDFSNINLNENYKFAKSHDWRKCALKHIKAFEEVLNRN